MTDISFLTESVTEVDRCCKEIVGINLPECCLGTEFNLLTAAAYYEGVLESAGRGRSERSDGTESPGTISHSQEAPYADGPPAGGPSRRACPRAGGVRRRAGARAGGVTAGAKEESAGAAVANKSYCA